MLRGLLLVFFAGYAVGADADPDHAANAAFDQYAKTIEERLNQQADKPDFLWLDHHDREKSLVWLNQMIVTDLASEPSERVPEVPGFVVQHWLGSTFVTDIKLDRVRDLLLNFADYKNYFKRQIADSKLIKREDQGFDSTLRLRGQPLGNIDVRASAVYRSIEPTRSYIWYRSTSVDDSALARLNLYWRLEEADSGTYVELESVTLLRTPSGFRPGRVMKSLAQSFPRNFTSGLTETVLRAFPRPK